MEEKQLSRAFQMREAGKLTEAYRELVEIAENSEEPFDKAEALLHAAMTLVWLKDYDAVAATLERARSLMQDACRPGPATNERLLMLQTFLDFQHANLTWLRGGNITTALSQFDETLKQHKQRLTTAELRSVHEAIQIRRAFILADLGRWKEALPILESVKASDDYKEGIAFYLGHCYLASDDYIKAELKLTEALRLGGLPNSLEYSAHCELGMTYYNLRDYKKAKAELEKGANAADAKYIKESSIWRWLELTCRALGLKAEADQYARMARPS